MNRQHEVRQLYSTGGYDYLIDNTYWVNVTFGENDIIRTFTVYDYKFGTKVPISENHSFIQLVKNDLTNKGMSFIIDDNNIIINNPKKDGRTNEKNRC